MNVVLILFLKDLKPKEKTTKNNDFTLKCMRWKMEGHLKVLALVKIFNRKSLSRIMAFILIYLNLSDAKMLEPWF